MKSERRGLSLGISTIMVTFVILCITTFAIMSLISARADNNLAVRQAVSVTEFYQADSGVEEQLAKITAAVNEALTKSNSKESFIAILSEDANVNSYLAEENGDAIMRLSVPIREDLSIEAAYKIEYIGTNSARLICLTHQVRSTATYNIDDNNLPVWLGDDISVQIPGLNP